MAKRKRAVGCGSSAAARHESAHAVVAAALGLPLEAVSITGGRLPLEGGRFLRIGGYTRLAVSVSENWHRDCRDPVSRERLAHEAIMSAAGLACDLTEGGLLGDESARVDLLQVCRAARMLGFGASLVEDNVRRFLANCIEAAADILMRDACRPWNRVANVLQQKTALTGDQVRACIAGIDSGEVWRAVPVGLQEWLSTLPSLNPRLVATLGGNVTVADMEYGIVATVRLLKIERDLLNNMNTRLTLANRPVLLTTLLTPAISGGVGETKMLISSAGAASVLTIPATDTPITAFTAPATIPAGTTPTVVSGGSQLTIQPGAGVTVLPSTPGGASTAVAVASPGAPPPSRPSSNGTSGGGRTGLK